MSAVPSRRCPSGRFASSVSPRPCGASVRCVRAVRGCGAFVWRAAGAGCRRAASGALGAYKSSLGDGRACALRDAMHSARRIARCDVSGYILVKHLSRALEDTAWIDHGKSSSQSLRLRLPRRVILIALGRRNSPGGAWPPPPPPRSPSAPRFASLAIGACRCTRALPANRHPHFGAAPSFNRRRWRGRVGSAFNLRRRFDASRLTLRQAPGAAATHATPRTAHAIGDAVVIRTRRFAVGSLYLRCCAVIAWASRAALGSRHRSFVEVHQRADMVCVASCEISKVELCVQWLSDIDCCRVETL